MYGKGTWIRNTSAVVLEEAEWLTFAFVMCREQVHEEKAPPLEN